MTDLHDTEDREHEVASHAGAEAGGVEDLLEELIEIVTSAKSMPLSSSAIMTATRCSTCSKRSATSCPRSCAAPGACSRTTRSCSRPPGARPPTSSATPGSRPSAWCSAPRSCARPSTGRCGSSRTPRPTARQMRHEAEDYVDRKLAGFEIVLDRTIKTVRTGRERLASIPAPQAEPGDESADGEPERTSGWPGRASSTRTSSDPDRSGRPVRRRRGPAAQAPGHAAHACRWRGPIAELEVSGSARAADEREVVVRRGARVGVRGHGRDRDRLCRLGGRVPPLPRARDGTARGDGPRALLRGRGPRGRLLDDRRLARPRAARPRCLYPRAAARAAVLGPTASGCARAAARTATSRPAPARRRPTRRWAALCRARYRPKLHPSGESDDGRPEEEDLEVEEPEPASLGLDACTAPARSLCPQCNRAKLPHVVCPHCGWYKGRQAIEVD